MNIAFTGNHGRTALFKAVSDILAQSGHTARWIATGSREMFSILKSVPPERVLDVSVFSDTDENALAELEKHSLLTVDAIISADRIIRHKPRSLALAYISSAYNNLYRFLTDGGVSLVFGEATWAHEIVTAAVCSAMGIPFLSPVNVRYPSDRFAFFEGAGQECFVQTGVPDISAGQRLYREFSGRRPFYMERGSRGVAGPFIRHAYRHLTGDTADLTVPSLYSLIKDGVLKRLPRRKHGGVPEGRYVYLPLQCSPESSLDVLGWRHADQTEFVRSVSRALPAGFKLAVKEHPLRVSSLYSKLKNIPAAVMTDADSHELIKGASAVVSVSGTACYEAGLYGVPAVTFSDLFFNVLPTVFRCRSFDEFGTVLERAVNAEHDEKAVTAFLAKLHAGSFEGFAESEHIYRGALLPDNVTKVALAFRKVIECYSSSKSTTADSM